MENAGEFLVIKARIEPGKPREFNQRYMRLIGRYPTFDAACDGAVRACEAYRREEDARGFRYLVKHVANAPAMVLARISPRTPRGKGKGAA